MNNIPEFKDIDLQKSIHKLEANLEQVLYED